MSETGLSVVTSLFTAVTAAVGTGPFGGADLPVTDLNAALRDAPPVWEASVEDAVVGRVSFRSGKESGLPLNAYPKHFLNAVLAAEDGRFQEHAGADPLGLAAAVKDTLTVQVRGGSSITQQLIKNAVVGNAQTLDRKVNELILSVRAETAFPKADILESYLRHAWFGRGAEGAAHAPAVWFGKSWEDLSLAECATLAAMLKGPARFDPHAAPERVKARRDAVLRKMAAYGWADPAEVDAAIAEPVVALPPPDPQTGDPWVLSALRRAAEDYALRNPLAAHTLTSTVSPEWQEIAETAVKSAKIPKGAEAALVILRIPDGDLMATVGGVDAKASGYDRTFAKRQPGSLGKPLFYGAALDLGLTPWDLVDNGPITWGGSWKPKNYDGSTTAPAPLYQGLEASSNLMTVHLSEFVPMEGMFRIAEMSGAWEFGGIQPYAPSLLGASETTLRRITAGMAGLVNEGRTVPIRTFLEDAPNPTVFLSPSSANHVLAMMRGVMERGTARVAGQKSKIPLAGKTGTSQNHRDAWFVGLTPHIAVGVWVGRDDDKPLGAGVTGGVVSADIAISALNAALAAGLITESGFLPEQFISAHADWPPPLIAPGPGTVYVSSVAPDPYIGADSAYEPGDEQIEAYLEQLNANGW